VLWINFYSKDGRHLLKSVARSITPRIVTPTTSPSSYVARYADTASTNAL